MSVLEFITHYSAIVVTAVVIIASILHYKRKYSLWRSLGITGPLPFPLIGSSIDAFFDSVPISFVKRSNKYGRLYGLYDVQGAALVIADPKLVKQLCVKDFHCFTNRNAVNHNNEIMDKMMINAKDEQWKRLRRIISPTFTTGKIKRMKPLIERCAQNANEFLELTAAKKELLNLKQFWSRFTLEVIGRCAFSADIDSHKDPENELFKHVTKFFHPPGVMKLVAVIMILAMPRVLRKRAATHSFPTESVNYLSAVIIQLLKQRRESTANYNDFVSLLLEAEQEKENKSDSPLTETEIISNCILFFLAGHETTATLLNWFSYAMAMNPEIQEKLYNEIKSYFPNNDAIDYDLANKLPYLDAVVCETLRMYPPVVFVDRQPSCEVLLEDVDLTVPKNCRVTIPVYAIHHDPQFYPEPESFKPERFYGENRDDIDPYAYLPFGTGPRNCVAMRFALIEAKLAIIYTLSKFKFVKCVDTPAKPKFLKVSQFLVSKDIYVDVIKR